MSEAYKFMQTAVLPELPSAVLQRIVALVTDMSDIRSLRLVSKLACATVDRHIAELRISGNIDKHSTPYLRHVTKARVMRSTTAKNSAETPEHLRVLLSQMHNLAAVQMDCYYKTFLPGYVESIPMHLVRIDFPKVPAARVLSAGDGVVMPQLRSCSFEGLTSAAVYQLAAFAPNLRYLFAREGFHLAPPANSAEGGAPKVLQHLTHLMTAGHIDVYSTAAAAQALEGPYIDQHTQPALQQSAATAEATAAAADGQAADAAPAAADGAAADAAPEAANLSEIIPSIFPNLEVVTFGSMYGKQQDVGGLLQPSEAFAGCSKLKALHSFTELPWDRWHDVPALPRLEYFATAYADAEGSSSLVDAPGLKHIGVLSHQNVHGDHRTPNSNEWADDASCLMDLIQVSDPDDRTAPLSLTLPAALLCSKCCSPDSTAVQEGLDAVMKILANTPCITRVLFVGDSHVPYLEDVPEHSGDPAAAASSSPRLAYWLQVPETGEAVPDFHLPEGWQREVLLLQECQVTTAAAAGTAVASGCTAGGSPAAGSNTAVGQQWGQPVTELVCSRWVVNLGQSAPPAAAAAPDAAATGPLPAATADAGEDTATVAATVREPHDTAVLRISDKAVYDEERVEARRVDKWGSKAVVRAVLQLTGFPAGVYSPFGGDWEDEDYEPLNQFCSNH